MRCWYASEGIIDEEIRYYDKLLLILSEASVKSRWVKKEVMSALEEEKRRQTARGQEQRVLFPVRLDEAVMETKSEWAQEIQRTRPIGDFCQWEDLDEFQKALDRLLRDLEAEGTRPATEETP